MDKVKNKEKNEELESKRDNMDWLKVRLKKIGGGEKGSLLKSLGIFTLGVLLSRCHIVFGARPLGIALVALFPSGVWLVALGSVVGSITVGVRGVIFGIAALLTVFLRVIISGGFGDGRAMFGESLGARLSVSVIGGFVVSAYELLLYGPTPSAVAFSVAMILLPPIAAFLMSGLFGAEIKMQELLFGRKRLFSLRGKSDTEKMNTVFFGLSALTLSFFVTLALGEMTVLGISLSYVFVSLVTIISAKRLGPLKAMAVGFVSPLGISGIYAVSFALMGLGAGLLFGIGAVYSLISGGALLCAWSVYVGGLSGLLGTLPEYLIAAALAAPLIKGVGREREEGDELRVSESARDMVGTVALKFQNTRSMGLDSLESALSSIAELMRVSSDGRMPLNKSEYGKIVLRAAERRCSSCNGRGLCEREGIKPCVKAASRLSDMLFEGKEIFAEDVNGDTEFCASAGELAREISSEVKRAEIENYRRHCANSEAEKLELVARLIGEVRYSDAVERAPADELTEPLREVAENFGFEDGVIRAFGSRRKHFIIAGEDERGDRISSSELKLGIEAASGVRLGSAEYYRHGKMALMECDVRRSYKAECATAQASLGGGDASGDTVAVFESREDRFYALISDGMGSGEVAGDTSEFAVEFLRRALDFSAARDTVLHLLNNVMRGRREECSATVDLFELDLLSGDATFVKSGAAPSFVKRGDSIFRIKSQTAPLGLLRSIDTEKIRVEVREGDLVIMLSDGILQSAEESPWLLELLSRPPKRNLKEYADLILSEAKRHSGSSDDMSVAVVKIGRE